MASSQEAITNKEEMKTIQELQQETAEKWNNTVFPSKEDGDSIEHMDIGYKNFFKEIASDQQSAYDLGCEVTMERVRGLVNPALEGEIISKMAQFKLDIALSPTPESDLIAKK